MKINIDYKDMTTIFSLYENNEKIAYLEVCLNTITAFECYIPNKGYGSVLLKYVIRTLKKDWPCIYLDDMSERYRKLHNIYVKYGFEYVDEDGPEMIYKF